MGQDASYASGLIRRTAVQIPGNPNSMTVRYRYRAGGAGYMSSRAYFFESRQGSAAILASGVS